MQRWWASLHRVHLPGSRSSSRQTTVGSFRHHLMQWWQGTRAPSVHRLRSPTAAKVDPRCLCRPMWVWRGQTDTHRQPARSLLRRHHHLFPRILAQLSCDQLERRKMERFRASGAHQVAA
jgi:hypothetical protein